MRKILANDCKKNTICAKKTVKTYCLICSKIIVQL